MTVSGDSLWGSGIIGVDAGETTVREPSADYNTVTDETQGSQAVLPDLPTPARYVPIDARPFGFHVGLGPLERDLGNGPADRRAFQLDTRWPAYRRAKLAARAESLPKYFQCVPGQEDLLAAVARSLSVRLADEYPQHFEHRDMGQGRWRLGSRLSACTVESEGVRAVLGLRDAPGPAPVHVLDALALDVQEDVAVMRADGETMRLIALHVCFPNHWSPAAMLGRDFSGVHARVPGLSQQLRDSDRLQAVLVGQGPWVRFAWGLATDTRLNHHPDAPRDGAATPWEGRSFDPERPRLWLRVERQVFLPVPEFAAYVFLIRTYFEPVAGLSLDERLRLAHALETMDEQVLAYKGLGRDRNAILAWLRTTGVDAPGIS